MNKTHEYTTFLNILFKKIDKTELKLSNYQLDHIAYRTERSEEFEDKKIEFEKIGKLNGEIIIRDRRISVYGLNHPIKFKNFTIEAVEILEPAENNKYRSGWQHTEFVVDKPLITYTKQYPNYNWKTKSINRELNPELTLMLDDYYGIKLHTLPILEAQRKQIEAGKF